MKLKACDIQEFILHTQGKEVVCWGAGGWLSFLSEKYDYEIEKSFSYVVDSNLALHGTIKNINGQKLTIKSPQYLFENLTQNTVVLITMRDWEIVYEMLENNELFMNTECYLAVMIHVYQLDTLTYSPFVPKGYRMENEPQIPKIIHYIWFGGKSIPDKFKVYMESWSRFCPDYEIKEWNESNYDVEAHPFMRETMRQGRPGFTADYARFDIIYRYGGIYLDVDVELLRNLDELLYNRGFCSFHFHDSVNLGHGFGAAKGHSIIKKLRDSYDNISFDERDEYGIPIVSPIYQTETLVKCGLILNGQFQTIENMAIYPAVYFDAISRRTDRSFITENTFAIHHYAGSWLTEAENTLLTGIRTKTSRANILEHKTKIQNGGKNL